MKYDDASWHYDGDFPDGLPTDAAATHIGMFVAWCMLNGLAGALAIDELPDELEELGSRRLTPGQYVIQAWDEKFIDEELSDEGNEFALAYYGPPGGIGLYLTDYQDTLGQGEPTLYHIEDTWENYDKLAPVIANRFREWKAGKLAPMKNLSLDLNDLVKKKPWWKFW